MRTQQKSRKFQVLIPLALTGVLVVAACDGGGTGGGKPQPTQEATQDTIAFASAPGGGETEAADSLVLRAQVALDRAGFSVGVIDGKDGATFKQALGGFQETRGLPVSGTLDQLTQDALFGGRPTAATKRVVIPEGFARGPFEPNLPHDEAELARYPHLSYRSLTEALAERFHTTPVLLVSLNGPGTRIGAGATIRVPDIPDVPRAEMSEDPRGWADALQRLAVAPDQPAADKLVVDRSQGTLRAYDGAGKLLAQFPVTTGSSKDPLPIGTWKVRGESRNPDYQYNPDLFWDAGKNDKATRLPPGPNGPVGVVWIDLSKEHYGIHGTPEPQNIGKTESHGCVRLTNWDAARLAQMVKTGTTVVFEE